MYVLITTTQISAHGSGHKRSNPNPAFLALPSARTRTAPLRHPNFRNFLVIII
jgi:hypothetical protein